MTDEPEIEIFEFSEGFIKPKRKQKTKAKQRSMKRLRDNGWTCCDVEKWIPPRGKMKFGVRVDAFGIGDILACKPAITVKCRSCDGKGVYSGKTESGTFFTNMGCSICRRTGKETTFPGIIALVQCFSDTGALVGFQSHREKILALPEALAWIKSNGRIYLHGWKKRKAGWILTEEEVILAS